MKKKLNFSIPIYLLFMLILLQSCEQTNIKKPFRTISKIVFLSNRDSEPRQFDVFTMNLDGSEQINLTRDLNSIRTHSRPILSPDQHKLVFTAFEDSGPVLKLFDLQDSTFTTLCLLTHVAPHAEFSPDGKTIVFVQKVDDRRQIYQINSDGTGERNLSNNNFDEYNPSFASDGKQIVCVSNRNNSYLINIFNLETLKVNEINVDCGIPANPKFSQDISMIVFSAEQNRVSDIYIMKSNGKHLQNLTLGRYRNTFPQFTPDGSKLLFLSNERGMKYQDICIIDVKGRQITNLTRDLNYINQHFNITPDGRFIIFDSVKFNDCEIFKVEIKSGELVNLSNHPKWDQSPNI